MVAGPDRRGLRTRLLLWLMASATLVLGITGVVDWSLESSTPEPTTAEVHRVGAAPVTLDWGGQLGLWEMDCSSLVAKRRGAGFRTLFVGDWGFLVYLHGHLILGFGHVQRVADGQPIMYVYEEV